MCFWLALLRMLICCVSSERSSEDCSTVARCILGNKGRRKGESSDWLVIDGLFVPSETIPPAVPIFPMFSLSIPLPLLLLNVLLFVPLLEFRWHCQSYITLRQPALHRPDVITTCSPETGASWHFDNPAAPNFPALCSPVQKQCVAKTKHISQRHSVNLINLLIPFHIHWLSTVRPTCCQTQEQICHTKRHVQSLWNSQNEKWEI